jgi:hypothetical protein
MMKRIILSFVTALAITAGAACFDFKTSATPTGPTNTTSQALSGTWSGVQSLPGASGSLADACVNFQWSVTQISGTSGSGTFSATCLGNIQVSGSASATLTGSTLNWSANASGTINGQTVCAIALTGTATLEANNRIRIPYSGTTCLGPVSGTEIIQR